MTTTFAHIPSSHYPPGHFPAGYFWLGAATGYNIYRGVGSADAIDWASPVAIAAGNEPVRVSDLHHAHGLRYFYAAAHVDEPSPGHAPRVLTCVEMSAQGVLLEPLADVVDLSAQPVPGGTLVCFSYRGGQGLRRPAAFDVLCAASTPQQVLATVPAHDGNDYRVFLRGFDGAVQVLCRP